MSTENARKNVERILNNFLKKFESILNMSRQLKILKKYKITFLLIYKVFEL
jgi:hypothetical protein